MIALLERMVITVVNKKEQFNRLLKEDLIILDGAMGTMIMDEIDEISTHQELININNPEIIKNIHKKYISAGAKIIYANTFNLNKYKYKDCEYDYHKLIKEGIKIAKEASNNEALVALDIGPIGTMLEPNGQLKFEEAYNIFKDIIITGNDADLIVFETMSDLYELKAAVLAAQENSDLPIITSFTFEANGRSFSGCSVAAYACLMEALDVDVIGVNCSLGPKDLLPIVKELAQSTTKPIAVKANAGLPNPTTNKYTMSSNEFCEINSIFLDYGIKLIGGCCGTRPQFIKDLAKLKNKNIIKKIDNKLKLCSGLDVVKIDSVKIVGERINPTGKPKFKQALINNDMSYILKLAIEQVDAKADILDVNVGVLEVNESEMMVKLIKEIQSVVNVPLQIDSTNVEAISAGLRVYNGKPIVNSVNGESKKLDEILPLVKKYGASVIGLTIDEDGIPKTALKRFQIAEKILDRALFYGIKKEDIIIDCLTLTVASAQDQVFETLSAMKMIKEKLGLKLTLGISNISFGLPDRKTMNQTFLTMAINSGLDLAIINPNVTDLIQTVYANNVMLGYDLNCLDYISNYNKEEKKIVNTTYTIEEAISKGLKKEVENLVKKALLTNEPMKIINEMLVPSLDAVGDDYEKNIIYLPQLIKSASAASVGFEIIKNKLRKNNQVVNKGNILLCTVKGDVHDIGKNIVKVILENYGYNVIDLGKNVPIELVVEETLNNNVKLVGLSALMTTTSINMTKTIKALKDAGYKGKIVVGGAVITQSFATSINADYYAEDAKMAVKIASEVFNEN